MSGASRQGPFLWWGAFGLPPYLLSFLPLVILIYVTFVSHLFPAPCFSARSFPLRSLCFFYFQLQLRGLTCVLCPLVSLYFLPWKSGLASLVVFVPVRARSVAVVLQSLSTERSARPWVLKLPFRASPPFLCRSFL